MPAVGADDQVGIDFDFSLGRRDDKAAYAAVRLTESSDFGLHQYAERRVRACLGRHEVQEIPLRHQRNELAARRQVREVTKRQRLAPDAAGDVAKLSVRPLEELIENIQLMHDFERGGMDSIATEIAKEVLVLLENEDRHAGTRQEPAQHHAGRAAAGDGALDAHAPVYRTCDSRVPLATVTRSLSYPPW